MRISFQYQNMRYQQTLSTSLNDVLQSLDKVNKKRSILNPEASPSKYVAAYNIQRMIDDTTQFSANANNANGWLAAAETSIYQSVELITKVRDDLALNGANGVNNLESMRALAGDVMGIYNQLFDLANTTYMGRYIFSGFQTNTKPFSAEENQILSIVKEFGSEGGNLLARDTFSDLPELAAGEYSVKISIRNDTGYLTLKDKYGNDVILDSNGSDDALVGGNNVSTSLAFKIEPGKVINTGRGLAVKLPDSIGTGLQYSFTYVPGNYAGYYGDSGDILNKIGYNQNVQINFAGSDIFLENSKILRSLQSNTVNGLPLTTSSLFSQIDSANVGLGDSIKISGTDHNGYAVGSAKVLGTTEAGLNLSEQSAAERTLTITYAGKHYQIEVPADGYANIDLLLGAINHQIKSARYVGSAAVYPSYTDENDFTSAIAADVNGNLVFNSGAEYQVDLSSQITAVSDGGRLMFVTSDTGNKTYLAVTGGKYNTLGFEDKTVLALGKDTTFEVGYDFPESGINNIYTVHDDIPINQDITFIINGKPILFEAAALAAAPTTEAKELYIDRELRKAGLGYTVGVKLSDYQAGPPESYDFTFTMQNLNLDRDTRLSTYYYNIGGVSDYQFGTIPKTISASVKEKTVGDYMEFVRNLYDKGVEVTLENGNIAVRDLRSGSSRLSMNVQEMNEGMSLPIVDQKVIVGGNYTGGGDDRWSVTMDMTHDPIDGTKDVHVVIYNSQNVKIIDKVVENYTGGEIQLQSGVYIIANDMNTAFGVNPASASFGIDLKGKGALNFGDMNIVQTGENANIFTSLMNLYNALYNGINTEGWAEPSAWRDETLKSTAIPYFDGVFSGNFNALWNYEVVSNGGKTGFYIQDIFSASTADIKVDASAANLNFAIEIYDNDAGTLNKYNLAVPITAGMTAQELQQAIVNTVNTNVSLFALDVHASIDGGKVNITSGSGSRNITLIPDSEKDVYMMGYSPSVGSTPGLDYTIPASFDYVYWNGAIWTQTTVTLAGTYADTAAVLADINTQLIGTGGTASLDSGGALRITSADPSYISNITDPSMTLGITNSTLENKIADKRLIQDLTGTSTEARTLTFRYNDGSFKEASITIADKAYANYQDMLAEVNSKLAAAGLSTSFTAVMSGDKLTFKPAAAVATFSVEGDYEGTLGFRKTGDRAAIKVTDSNGRGIQNLYIDTAHKEYGVSDGLVLGFDVGSLFATDSFTGAVGSGIDYELGVLDTAQGQLTQAVTQVGNRRLRVESVINFNTSVLTTYENQKAVHLGSSEADQVRLLTEYELANKAYEYALTLTTRMMSLSILDYLNA
jgi:flagellin-like hook-associated protein FlgL